MEKSPLEFLKENAIDFPSVSHFPLLASPRAVASTTLPERPDLVVKGLGLPTLTLDFGSSWA
ncbi:hypothetical protein SCALM49S_07582 [Streptomyces californicus]